MGDYSRIVNERKFKEFTKIVNESYKFYLKLCKNYNKNPSNSNVFGVFEDEFNNFIYSKVCRGDKNLIFKKSIDNDTERKIYRGISSLSIDNYFKILKRKDTTVYRKGVYGDGMYFSSQMALANQYCDKYGCMIFATMADDCKLTDTGNLIDERYEFNKGYMQSIEFLKLPKNVRDWCKNNIIYNNRNNTFYAGFLGYDAIEIGHIYCVFNLDKITFEDRNITDDIEIRTTKKKFLDNIFSK